MQEDQRSITLKNLSYYFDSIRKEFYEREGLLDKFALFRAIQDRLFLLPDRDFRLIIKTFEGILESYKPALKSDPQDPELIQTREAAEELYKKSQISSSQAGSSQLVIGNIS